MYEVDKDDRCPEYDKQRPSGAKFKGKRARTRSSLRLMIALLPSLGADYNPMSRVNVPDEGMISPDRSKIYCDLKSSHGTIYQKK